METKAQGMEVTYVRPLITSGYGTTACLSPEYGQWTSATFLRGAAGSELQQSGEVGE